ncbi:WhiB family transcriptional regulator [Streptomyces sp. V1I6]|uniref:WhiB family transcriptional regulator n=1 Tax=Streptomyces sp. V1I6 TaxID=3042273 RepID=UPI0027836562|nr:WhiB family transcriptional regulator [Streptomyces sp. V1I6]MDQ0847576.1 WhiB family redox-sensing transcriptional regulator [Streptomyces sp. V1I6]
MHSMTPERAQASRRGALQSAIDVLAVCTAADPELFFRGDREQQDSWQARRSDAQRLCGICPVRAACAELALRNGEGRADVDDMVRGGLTGPELAEARKEQADRLTAAVDADRDTEGRRLDLLTIQLSKEAIVFPEKSGSHKTRKARDAAVEAQQVTVRLLADQIRETRSARRARSGWGVAA